MEEFLKTILVYAGVAGLVYISFDRFEQLANDELKEDISQFFSNRNKSDTSLQFSTLLNDVFGEKHVTLRCILLSIVVSVISVFVVFGLLSYWNIGRPIYQNNILNIMAGALLANILPDYISLAESRIIIQEMHRSKPFNKLLWLILDLVSTAGIYFFFMIIILMLIESGNFEFLKSLFGIGNPRILFATFISTFSTSIWIYLYLFGVRAIKITSKFYYGLLFLKYINWKRQPVRAIGAVTSLYVFVILVLIELVIRITS